MLSTTAALLVAALVVGCSDKIAEPEPPPKPTTSAASTPDPTELAKEDLKPGTGDREVKTGDKIKVHYVGRLLKTNAKFDSNEAKDKPFEFTVGEGVIEGWSQGVVGMKKGGKRKLTIPAKLAYGEDGHPPKIPGNAPLVFEVELVGWSDEPEAAPSGSAMAGEPAASASASAAAGAPKDKDTTKKPETKDGATKPASTAAPKAPATKP
jgi:hypothetical protein